MKHHPCAAGLLTAAIVTGLPTTAFAGSGTGQGTLVIKDVVVEVDHEATVLPGCSGAFVPMSFTGVNVLHVRIQSDGTQYLGIHVKETATWTEDGVIHTVPFENSFTFNRIDPVTQDSAIFTVTLHGAGTASDGTTTRLKLVGHTVISPDGTVKL